MYKGKVYLVMKHLLLCLLYLSSVFALNIYSLSHESSSLEWIGSKITGSHNGNIQFLLGEVVLNDKTILSGELIVNMMTIENSDISSEKYKGYLVNHLKSEDFFNVDSFPSAHLVILEHLENTEKNRNLGFNTMIKCNLTIKGITHEIDIPMKLDVYNSHAMASGTIDVDRTLYNIKYKSKSFFPDIGDKLIYNNFTLNFTIRANRLWEK